MSCQGCNEVDRPIEYYEGCGDGLRYAAVALASAYGHAEVPGPIAAVLAAIEELLDVMDDRRMAWFLAHNCARIPRMTSSMEE